MKVVSNFLIPLKLTINSQLITRFQSMTSLLSDLSSGFVDDSFFYDFISEIVANINGCVLIGICGVMLVSMLGLFLGGTVNATISLFVSNVRGMLYCMSWILIFLARKFAATYALGSCDWSLSMSIA